VRPESPSIALTFKKCALNLPGRKKKTQKKHPLTKQLCILILPKSANVVFWICFIYMSHGKPLLFPFP